MRVMIDTNVFMSALMFPSSTPSQAVLLVAKDHEMVLCDFITNEIREKIKEKRPDLLPATDALLETLEYTNALPSGKAGGQISDPDDVPILDAAISAEVDIIISGDKHFRNLTISKPKVLNPAEFLRQVYVQRRKKRKGKDKD
jgi:putative PIN family toxin of toxin-antitoxin system